MSEWCSGITLAFRVWLPGMEAYPMGFEDSAQLGNGRVAERLGCALMRHTGLSVNALALFFQ